MAGEIVAVEINGGRKYGGIYRNPPHFDRHYYKPKISNLAAPRRGARGAEPPGKFLGF